MDGSELAKTICDVARARWEKILPKFVVGEDIRGKDLSGVWAAFDFEKILRENPEKLESVHILVTQPPRQYILCLEGVATREEAAKKGK